MGEEEGEKEKKFLVQEKVRLRQVHTGEVVVGVVTVIFPLKKE